MDTSAVTEAVVVGLLASISVSLWTLRVAVAAAGRRLAAAAIAAVEAVLFAAAFSALITALDDPLRIGAYAAGVAVGTLAGLTADERISRGQSLVQIVVDGDGDAETSALRARGWPVTSTPADGVRGRVAVLSVAVDDSVLPHLRADVDHIAPAGFETTERLRTVRPTALPTGMHITRAAPRPALPARATSHRVRAPDTHPTPSDPSRRHPHEAAGLRGSR